MTEVEENRVKTARALVKQGDMNKENETSYLQGIFNTRKNVYRLKSGDHMYMYNSIVSNNLLTYKRIYIERNSGILVEKLIILENHIH